MDNSNEMARAEEARILHKKEQAAEAMYDALLNCRFFDTPVMRRKLGNDPFVLDILASVRAAIKLADEGVAEPIIATRQTRNGTKVQFIRDNDNHSDYMRRKVWRIVSNGVVFYTSPEGQVDTNNSNHQHDLDVMGEL